jgi:hypothetical protein
LSQGRLLDKLAVGPQEDLIQDHGSLVIDWIELEAQRDKDFAALLPKVWIPASDDSVTQRFVKLGCDQVRVIRSIER